MAKVGETKQYNNFSAGFVSDANEVNFPAGAAVDIQNMRLNRDGSLERRQGMDIEAGSSYTTTTSNKPFYGFYWGNVAGYPDEHYYIDTSYVEGFMIWDASTDPFTFHSVISDQKARYKGGSSPSSLHYSFAELQGRVYIVNPDLNPLVLYKDASGFHLDVLLLKERNLKGLDDGYDPSRLVRVLSDAVETDVVKWNAKNQGWPENLTDWTTVQSTRGWGPSNSEAWLLGRRIDPATGVDGWNYSQFAALTATQGAVPKGHFIQQICSGYDIDSDGASIPANITSITGSYGVYAGVPTMHLNVSFDAAHGISAGDYVRIRGNLYEDTGSGSSIARTLDGVWYVQSALGAGLTIDIRELDATSVMDFDTPFGLTSGSSYGTWTHIVVGGVGDIIQATSIDERPSVVGAYAGRVWYGGINYPGLLNRLYYSKIVENDRDPAICYQEADPTSDIDNTPVDTDGGYVEISGLGKLEHTVTFGKYFLLFSDRGVWAVTGAGAYFTPTSYDINQVTNLPCISSMSVIVADNYVYYWSNHHLVRIGLSAETQALTVDTEFSAHINTFYNSLSTPVKEAVTGAFIPYNNQVQWLYLDNSSIWVPPVEGGTKVEYKNSILTFNIKTGAFTKDLVDADTTQCLLTQVVANPFADSVYNAAKYLSSISETSVSGRTLGWGSFSDTDHVDWASSYLWGGEDAAAYVTVGYETLGDPSKDKQATYVTTYFKRTETAYVLNGSGGLAFDYPSSCYLRADWDWADSDASGSRSTPREVYRLKRVGIPSGVGAFDNGRPVTVTKNKIRGHGRALSLNFASNSTNSMHLLGYTIDHTGRSKT